MEYLTQVHNNCVFLNLQSLRYISGSLTFKFIRRGNPEMYLTAPVIYYCVTNHLKTQWLETTMVYICHNSTGWLGSPNSGLLKQLHFTGGCLGPGLSWGCGDGRTSRSSWTFIPNFFMGRTPGSRRVKQKLQEPLKPRLQNMSLLPCALVKNKSQSKPRPMRWGERSYLLMGEFAKNVWPY